MRGETSGMWQRTKRPFPRKKLNAGRRNRRADGSNDFMASYRSAVAESLTFIHEPSGRPQNCPLSSYIHGQKSLSCRGDVAVFDFFRGAGSTAGIWLDTGTQNSQGYAGAGIVRAGDREYRVGAVARKRIQ